MLQEGRSPCGERGLKCAGCATQSFDGRRSPCGERGLKYRDEAAEGRDGIGRSPCGERGLKYDVREQNSGGSYVAPRAGSVD